MRGYILILSFFCLAAARGQEVPLNTEQQLENVSEENMEEDALLQQLEFFQKHPLNLNNATANDLYLLRFLTGLQIHNLLQYRLRFGKLLSVYELQAVPSFDLPTIKKLLPYITVGDIRKVKETFRSRLHGGSSYALGRISRVLEPSKGYNANLRTHYLGNRNHMQFRYSYQYKNLLYYGMVADKDAGEQFFKGAQKAGFDFYSVHFFARDLGTLKALALGDYTLNLGQGLIQWHSLAFGKSAEVINIKRQAAVLLPYRSAGEFYFNRGAAATFQWRAIQATTFVSYKKFSGNLIGDSLDRFSSFAVSGYHRTRLEVADRHKIGHFTYGGNLSFQNRSLKIGVNAITHNFSLPLQKRDEPYNHFALAGKSHSLASIDYSYTLKNVHFFGELAADNKLNKAVVQGAMVSLDPKLDFSFLYRNIAKGFQSPFGNAFTESTLPANEYGLYSGLLLRPSSSWQFAAYADLYAFPFLKYRVSSPSRGWDYLAQLTYVPQKKTEVYLRYRIENKPLNGAGQTLNFPVDHVRKNLRFHLATQVNRQVSLKARTEMVWFTKDRQGEEGILTYLETGYEPSAKLKGNFRLQYFETGGYDSRIYAYESDVLYSFSIPGFFDKGYRYYLNISYHSGEKLTLWIRLAQTRYLNKTVIGSALDQINGRYKTDVRIQLRYRFN